MTAVGDCSAPAKRAARTALVFVALAFVTSAVRFAFAQPACETVYPLLVTPERGPTMNLASFQHGPTVRVSSVNFFDRHHSGYLIDGTNFTPEQKWMSDKTDRSPWVEIHFRGAHHLAAVRLSHAGILEPRQSTAASYTLTCLVNGKPSAIKAVIEGNVESRPVHPIACENATGIRIDFRLRGADAVRLYEVEALGIW
jgi:hypothetical protein